MSRSLLCDAASEIDVALRILAANRLPHRLLADVLAIPVERIDAMADGGPALLWPAEQEMLRMFIAVMVRLEIRFGHEPRYVRRALATPLDLLGGRTPEQAMKEGVDGLRAVHRAAGEMALPATRWWRVPPHR
ncbi:DUF2384 domain-containing protein [Sphingomonas sp. CGMCC 1.13654]|uniref:DUF2384 domain-containing protein n=1 Tax=Sphingomonas chungangi TaxID=2683589 RepID=A0A838L753_9SPHN|nr:DUF2384 domain-containing protein [Sphingomonas chungangi]MBA2935151.1 DUF2384 domain-containing protein [Sphingomonas chungangi]MVW57715.1 DUF2384 domain-containing protein [Sphingomonas chungangi]